MPGGDRPGARDRCAPRASVLEWLSKTCGLPIGVGVGFAGGDGLATVRVDTPVMMMIAGRPSRPLEP